MKSRGKSPHMEEPVHDVYPSDDQLIAMMKRVNPRPSKEFHNRMKGMPWNEVQPRRGRLFPDDLNGKIFSRSLSSAFRALVLVLCLAIVFPVISGVLNSPVYLTDDAVVAVPVDVDTGIDAADLDDGSLLTAYTASGQITLEQLESQLCDEDACKGAIPY